MFSVSFGDSLPLAFVQYQETLHVCQMVKWFYREEQNRLTQLHERRKKKGGGFTSKKLGIRDAKILMCIYCVIQANCGWSPVHSVTIKRCYALFPVFFTLQLTFTLTCRAAPHVSSTGPLSFSL